MDSQTERTNLWLQRGSREWGGDKLEEEKRKTTLPRLAGKKQV